MYKIIYKSKSEMMNITDYFDIENNILPFEASLLSFQYNTFGYSYISAGFGDIIICKNAELPILRGHLPTISRIILEDLNNGKYKLHIRDMSQDIEDPIPRFEITAEDFQVYRWDYEKYGIKNERGWYENIPTLKEFIKWYEENCEADQNG